MILSTFEKGSLKKHYPHKCRNTCKEMSSNASNRIDAPKSRRRTAVQVLDCGPRRRSREDSALIRANPCGRGGPPAGNDAPNVDDGVHFLEPIEGLHMDLQGLPQHGAHVAPRHGASRAAY